MEYSRGSLLGAGVGVGEEFMIVATFASRFGSFSKVAGMVTLALVVAF